ncbi:MAG: enoyl-CoA hydratase [Novosphingobium sp.]|nr:enoyl-CoA hydratase [Novosphingobium sp.]
MGGADDNKPLVHIERSNGVAVITLSSPETGNALGVEMAEALLAKVQLAANDAAVRCVLLTAEGRFFCVGGDVKRIAASGDGVGALLDRITTPLHAAVSILLHMDKPLVTAVNGPVAGGGLGLAVVGDIVLASDSAHFSMAYTGIGFSPDGGSSWLLPRLIGLRKTQELAYLNSRLASEEAVALGLITRAVPAENLARDARDVADALAKGPVAAFAATRRLLLPSGGMNPEAQMDMEAASVRAQAIAAEGREGVSAFLGKRQPNFAAMGGDHARVHSAQDSGEAV